jgi:hypothetical protein
VHRRIKVSQLVGVGQSRVWTLMEFPERDDVMDFQLALRSVVAAVVRNLVSLCNLLSR